MRKGLASRGSSSGARRLTAPARSAALGEAAIGITYLHNGIRLIKEGNTNVRLSLPEEGTAYELGAVAIIKNAPDMEAAKKFVDWALTKKAQEIGQHNNSYQFLTNLRMRNSLITTSSGPAITVPVSWKHGTRQ